MKKVRIFLILLLPLFFQCGTDYDKESNLSKLSRNDIITYQKEGLLNCVNIRYNNKKASPEDLDLVNTNDFCLDYFANEEGKIKLCKIRQATYQDHITEILKRNINYDPFDGIPLMDINCEKLNENITELRRLTPDDYKQMLSFDTLQIQKLGFFDYTRIVFASIDKACGIENLPSIGKITPYTFWSMVHHNENEAIAYYYPYFDNLVNVGVLHPESLALSTDRLLEGNGYKQAFGSQIVNGQLPIIRDLDSVDARRARIGLEPLNDYLDVYGLKYAEN